MNNLIMSFKKFNFISFILIITLFSSLILFTSCSSQKSVREKTPQSNDSQFSSFSSLSPKDFSRVINLDDVVVIDIRTLQELQELGFISQKDLEYDFYNPNFASQIDSLNKTVKYAIYCYHGTRSAALLSYMKKSGFKNVVDLDGGIDAWLKEGLPVNFPPFKAYFS